MSESRSVERTLHEAEERISALERAVAELQVRTAGLVTLGPKPETDELKARSDKFVAAVQPSAPPPVDRSKLCTTDGRSVAAALASQTNETGQHPSYIVLCAEERAKGFVRPYRDSYKHVGRAEQLVNDAGEPSHRPRLGGCGTVTTMGRALSETYARDPNFYSHTFCCGCNGHLPVSEFVWTADGTEVGS